MKYSHLSTLRRIDGRLQKEALWNYRGLILSLCQDHLNYDFVQRLDSYFRQERYTEAVLEADVLSSQLYDDATQTFVAHQFAALIRKYPWPKGSVDFDPEATGYAKFVKSEHKCKLINRRFIARRRRIGLHPYESELDRMRKFIRYVLSDEPNIRSILSKCNFGPGASIGVHGKATNFARKLLASNWSVSSSAYQYAYSAIMNHAQFREVLLPEHGGFIAGSTDFSVEKQRFRDKCVITGHNNISFVPKTAITHRSIAVEPLLNGFLQKGIDLEMRDFLRRIGIDLNRQEPNCEMAREGSLDTENGFVTIDLSAASDSLSTEVVRELVPPDWYDLFDRTRSKSFKYQEEVHLFQKFCSMGNGFCFPLETLVFTAACDAVGAGRPGLDFRVYGDDIIVRKPFSEPLLGLLGYLGFAVNKSKTFVNGPFRESCGADWFDGKDLRPYTLDHALDSVQSVNKFLNLSRRSPLTTVFFAGVRDFLLSRIPKSVQFWRPFHGNADTGIDSTGDEHLTALHCRYVPCRYGTPNGVWTWKELSVVPISDDWYRTHTGKGGEPALLYGAYGGAASACPFSMRSNTRTKVRVVSHPGATSTWLPPYENFWYSYDSAI